jgi:hypothetical protein
MFVKNIFDHSQNRDLFVTRKKSDTKRQSEDVKPKQQILDELKDRWKDILDPTSGMSDEEKARYEEKVNQKIKNGEKLTGAEMQFIKMKSPYLYAMISRVQLQRQALEEKLKHCRSKEEVEDAYNQSMSRISKKDPAKVPLQAAYNNVTQEFKKTSQYKNLPQKITDKEKSHKLQPCESYKSNGVTYESNHFDSECDFCVLDKRA